MGTVLQTCDFGTPIEAAVLAGATDAGGANFLLVRAGSTGFAV